MLLFQRSTRPISAVCSMTLPQTKSTSTWCGPELRPPMAPASSMASTSGQTLHRRCRLTFPTTPCMWYWSGESSTKYGSVVNTTLSPKKVGRNQMGRGDQCVSLGCAPMYSSLNPSLSAAAFEVANNYIHSTVTVKECQQSFFDVQTQVKDPLSHQCRSLWDSVNFSTVLGLSRLW